MDTVWFPADTESESPKVMTLVSVPAGWVNPLAATGAPSRYSDSFGVAAAEQAAPARSRPVM